jgi:3(or 17)beta-hydroxysteroid dehydrogenase
MPGRVEDKVVIVTGGASGIGCATSRLLAAEAARVVIADLDSEGGSAIAKEIGGDAVFLRHDVSDEEDWRRLIAATLERFGCLDALVNNAGIMVPGTIEDASVEDFRRIQDVNSLGVFLGCKHAIPALRASGGGSIVNVSSLAALRGTSPYAAYSASKGAVCALTKTVAAHCVERGDPIRCNSVHPGGVDTPMLQGLLRAGGIGPGVGPEAARLAAGMADPEEIAALVLYLVSDESRFVNGAEIVIDGGLAARSPSPVVRGS